MTVQEFFLTIEDRDLRERALHYAIEQNTLTYIADDLYDAFNEGIDWSQTLEGGNYWREARKKYKEIEV